MPYQVYVIGPNGGPYKIGMTSWNGVDGNWRRVETLQTGCWLDLHFWGNLSCTESFAHNALCRYNIRGEWYEPHERVLQFLAEYGCDHPLKLYEATKASEEATAKLIALLTEQGYTPEQIAKIIATNDLGDMAA